MNHHNELRSKISDLIGKEGRSRLRRDPSNVNNKGEELLAFYIRKKTLVALQTKIVTLEGQLSKSQRMLLAQCFPVMVGKTFSDHFSLKAKATYDEIAVTVRGFEELTDFPVYQRYSAVLAVRKKAYYGFPCQTRALAFASALTNYGLEMVTEPERIEPIYSAALEWFKDQTLKNAHLTNSVEDLDDTDGHLF